LSALVAPEMKKIIPHPATRSQGASTALLHSEGISPGKWCDSSVLEKLWQAERQQSLYARQHPERSGPGWWSSRSESYTRRTGGERGKRRQEKVIELLEQARFINQRAEVLDIGCGPGNVALPVARRVKKVVALDPSADMLEIVNKRAAAEGIKNIETVQMRWEDADLDKLGWRGRFRLAIASMTPGIHDAVTLRKMNEASNCVCYYSGFTQRRDAAQEDLWRLFYNEPMPPLPSDVFCVFHLLHAWGYCPSVALSRESSRSQYAIVDAAQELGLLMIPYIEQTAESQEKIEQYVRSAVRNGKFTHERSFVEARMLWPVKH